MQIDVTNHYRFGTRIRNRFIKTPTGKFLIFSGSQFTDCKDSVINLQFSMTHLDFYILSSIYCILNNLNSYTGNVSMMFSRILD